MKTKTPQEKAKAFKKELKKLLKLANTWANDPNLIKLEIEFNFRTNAQRWEPYENENQTTEENI